MHLAIAQYEGLGLKVVARARARGKFEATPLNYACLRSMQVPCTRILLPLPCIVEIGGSIKPIEPLLRIP